MQLFFQLGKHNECFERKKNETIFVEVRQFMQERREGGIIK